MIFLKDEETRMEYMDVRGGTVPEAFVDPWELNVPELSNGAAVYRISNQAVDKEPGCTGEPLCFTALFHSIYTFCTVKRHIGHCQ